VAALGPANVDLHRRAVEAFNRHDPDAAVAFGHPEIEFHSLMTAPGGAVYHGRNGVRRWFRDLEDAWGEDFRIDAEAYFDWESKRCSFMCSVGGEDKAALRWRCPEPRWPPGKTGSLSTGGTAVGMTR
jgi:hypothetical protein